MAKNMCLISIITIVFAHRTPQLMKKKNNIDSSSSSAIRVEKERKILLIEFSILLRRSVYQSTSDLQLNASESWFVILRYLHYAAEHRILKFSFFFLTNSFTGNQTASTCNMKLVEVNENWLQVESLALQLQLFNRMHFFRLAPRRSHNL